MTKMCKKTKPLMLLNVSSGTPNLKLERRWGLKTPRKINKGSIVQSCRKISYRLPLEQKWLILWIALLDVPCKLLANKRGDSVSPKRAEFKKPYPFLHVL